MRSINVIRCQLAEAFDGVPAYYVDAKLEPGERLYTRLGAPVDVIGFNDVNPITFIKPNIFVAWIDRVRLASTTIYDKEMLEYLNSKL